MRSRPWVFRENWNTFALAGLSPQAGLKPWRADLIGSPRGQTQGTVHGIALSRIDHSGAEANQRLNAIARRGQKRDPADDRVVYESDPVISLVHLTKSKSSPSNLKVPRAFVIRNCKSRPTPSIFAFGSASGVVPT